MKEITIRLDLKAIAAIAVISILAYWILPVRAGETQTGGTQTTTTQAGESQTNRFTFFPDADGGIWACDLVKGTTRYQSNPNPKPVPQTVPPVPPPKFTYLVTPQGTLFGCDNYSNVCQKKN